MPFPLKFGNEIRIVSKIKAVDFTPHHHEIIAAIKYESHNLVIPDKAWSSIFLGAGEEKAVFCICDSKQHIFALEALDERTYLGGRFVGGEYFFDVFLSGLRNVIAENKAMAGLTFTGKVRIREFVHGYEWERFQFCPGQTKRLDWLLTAYLRAGLASNFNGYRSQYKDVHERNVLFEIRAMSERGLPAIVRDWLGKLKLVRVGLQPIDVR